MQLKHILTDEVYVVGNLKLTVRFTEDPLKYELICESIDGSTIRKKFEFNGFYNGYKEAKYKMDEIAEKGVY